MIFFLLQITTKHDICWHLLVERFSAGWCETMCLFQTSLSFNSLSWKKWCFPFLIQVKTRDGPPQPWRHQDGQPTDFLRRQHLQYCANKSAGQETRQGKSVLQVDLNANWWHTNIFLIWPYLCLYVCVYMSVSLCLCLYVCVYVSMSVSLCLCLYVCLYVSMSVSMSLYLCLYVCVFMSLSLCLHYPNHLFGNFSTLVIVMSQLTRWPTRGWIQHRERQT